MPRLFVDCDDTLILWNLELDDTGLWRPRKNVERNGDSYDLNQELIGAIDCFLGKHKEYSLIVWSGGGMDYAALWAERCKLKAAIIDKDMRHPTGDDILVDDLYDSLRPRDRRVRVFSPDSFILKCPLCAS